MKKRKISIDILSFYCMMYDYFNNNKMLKINSRKIPFEQNCSNGSGIPPAKTNENVANDTESLIALKAALNNKIGQLITNPYALSEDEFRLYLKESIQLFSNYSEQTITAIEANLIFDNVPKAFPDITSRSVINMMQAIVIKSFKSLLKKIDFEEDDLQKVASETGKMLGFCLNIIETKVRQIDVYNFISGLARHVRNQMGITNNAEMFNYLTEGKENINGDCNAQKKIKTITELITLLIENMQSDGSELIRIAENEIKRGTDEVEINPKILNNEYIISFLDELRPFIDKFEEKKQILEDINLDNSTISEITNPLNIIIGQYKKIIDYVEKKESEIESKLKYTDLDN